MDFTQVAKNTWFLELTTGIPVYFLTPKQIVLIDCGFFEQDGQMLRQFLTERQLHVSAVLVSHYHTDHVGNCLWLQEQGAEIIMPQWESVLGYSKYHRYLAYNPASVYDIQRLLPYMKVKADRTFAQDAASVEISGRSFKVLPLPGHTYGHTGYVTPDNICYVGDSLMTQEALASAKLPSTLDWLSDLKSKDSLLDTSYDAYLLAHKGIVSDIRDLVQINIEDRKKRADKIIDLLRPHSPLTLSDAEQILWTGLGLRSRNPYKITIYRRNVRCALEYLVESGKISSYYQGGTVFYAISDK